MNTQAKISHCISVLLSAFLGIGLTHIRAATNVPITITVPESSGGAPAVQIFNHLGAHVAGPFPGGVTGTVTGVMSPPDDEHETWWYNPDAGGDVITFLVSYPDSLAGHRGSFQFGDTPYPGGFSDLMAIAPGASVGFTPNDAAPTGPDYYIPPPRPPDGPPAQIVQGDLLVEGRQEIEGDTINFGINMLDTSNPGFSWLY